MKLNRLGTSVSEIIFIIAMGMCFIVPFVVTKQWWWVAFASASMLLVGLFELLSYFYGIPRKKTISQRFWAWSLTVKKWQVWALVSVVSLGWGMLIVHLVWKIL